MDSGGDDNETIMNESLSSLRWPFVPDFIDYSKSKNAGIKQILEQAGLLSSHGRGNNAAGRMIALFEMVCEEFAFTPRRKDGGRKSTPNTAPFLVEAGGEATCELAYWPGRILNPRFVKSWNVFLRNLDVDGIAKCCGEPESDDYKYHRVHLRLLRYFVYLAAERDEAILIYLGNGSDGSFTRPKKKHDSGWHPALLPNIKGISAPLLASHPWITIGALLKATKPPTPLDMLAYGPAEHCSN